MIAKPSTASWNSFVLSGASIVVITPLLLDQLHTLNTFLLLISIVIGLLYAVILTKPQVEKRFAVITLYLFLPFLVAILFFYFIPSEPQLTLTIPFVQGVNMTVHLSAFRRERAYEKIVMKKVIKST